MTRQLQIAFFGSSLVSVYWNGAATYYRGIIEALHQLGHSITFYEPDAFDRQKHRDLDAIPYARSVVYSPDIASMRWCLDEARGADIVVKCSGVGVFDDVLEEAVLERIERNQADPFRRLIPEYDLVLTYGGGEPVVNAYGRFGARQCVPIYNALSPSTHHPVEKSERFEADLAFCGNRMPDREARVAEFFLKPAGLRPSRKFLLGGNGWDGAVLKFANVRYLGHVCTADHNAFNATPLAVLNICRDSMARFGFSPATRVFEAAGAGACVITDRWTGLELFLTPGRECIAVDNGDDVAQTLDTLTHEQARDIGSLARQRILAEHTYAQRAAQVEQVLLGGDGSRNG
jgi:spore maturation protein CgeB